MPDHLNPAIGKPTKLNSSVLPLVLRVVGTSRHGQTINITAPRFTIGSGESCALRLRATGVRPLHCLIVRESQATLVCRLSEDTLLNGRPFRDSALCNGDRLQVGPIGLEVIQNGLPAVEPDDQAVEAATTKPQPAGIDGEARSKSTTADEANSQRSWDAVTSRPFEMLDRIERIENSLVEFEQRTLQMQESERAKSESAGEDPVAEPKSERFPDESNEWLMQAREWQTIKSELEAERAEHQLTRERLGELENELNALQVCCDDIIRARHAAEEQLRGIQAIFDSQLVQLQSNIDDWSGGFLARHEELQAAIQGVQAELVRYEKLVLEAADARVDYQPQFDQLREQLSQVETQLGRLTESQSTSPRPLVDADSASATVETDEDVRTELNAGCVEPEMTQPTGEPVPPTELVPSLVARNTSISSAASSISSANRRPELAWLAQQFATTPSDNCDTAAMTTDSSTPPCSLEPRAIDTAIGIETGTDEATDGDSMSRDPQTEQLSTGAIESQLQSAEDQQLDSRMTGELSFIRESVPTADESDLCGSGVSSSESAMLDLAASDDSGPDTEVERSEMVGATEVLLRRTVDESEAESTSEDAIARLARIGIWKSDPVENPHSESTSVETSEAPAEVVAKETAASEKPAEHPEEESIELYMRRLLERVRGDSERTVGSEYVIQEESSDAAPVEERVVEAPSTEILTESEFQPRSQAPEMNANLAAMRAIANDSRRKNILTHAQRTWSDRTQTNFIGAVAGVVVAVGSVFFLDTDPELAALGFFGGLAVTGILVWQAIRIRRQLFKSLKSQPDAE